MVKYREIYRCQRCGQEVGGFSISTDDEVSNYSGNATDIDKLRNNAKDMQRNVYMHECSDGKLGVLKFIGYDLRE